MSYAEKIKHIKNKINTITNTMKTNKNKIIKKQKTNIKQIKNITFFNKTHNNKNKIKQITRH